MDCEPGKSNDWSKETQKKYHIKVIQTATRVRPRDSSWVSWCAYPHELYFFPLKTLLASLLSVFVGILFCKAEGPGLLSLTAGLVARIWHFQSLARNPSPAPSRCRLRPPEITSTVRGTGLIPGQGTNKPGPSQKKSYRVLHLNQKCHYVTKIT